MSKINVCFPGSPFLFERKLCPLLLFKGLRDLSVRGYTCLRSTEILIFKKTRFVEILGCKADVFWSLLLCLSRYATCLTSQKAAHGNGHFTGWGDTNSEFRANRILFIIMFSPSAFYCWCGSLCSLCDSLKLPAEQWVIKDQSFKSGSNQGVWRQKMTPAIK